MASKNYILLPPFFCNVYMYLWRSANVSLLPGSNLPYYSHVFCIASLVKCIYLSLISWSDHTKLEVRTYPSWYQYPFILPLCIVTIMNARMSNFLPLYRRGFDMYNCTINDDCFPNLFYCLHFVILCLIYSNLFVHVIPWPLFEN